MKERDTDDKVKAVPRLLAKCVEEILDLTDRICLGLPDAAHRSHLDPDLLSIQAHHRPRREVWPGTAGWEEILHVLTADWSRAVGTDQDQLGARPTDQRHDALGGIEQTVQGIHGGDRDGCEFRELPLGIEPEQAQPGGLVAARSGS